MPPPHSCGFKLVNKMEVPEVAKAQFVSSSVMSTSVMSRYEALPRASQSLHHILNADTGGKSFSQASDPEHVLVIRGAKVSVLFAAQVSTSGSFCTRGR